MGGGNPKSDSRWRRGRAVGLITALSVAAAVLTLVNSGSASGSSTGTATVSAGLVDQAREQGTVEVIATLAADRGGSRAQFAELANTATANVSNRGSVDLLDSIGAVSLSASATDIQRLAGSGAVTSIEPDALLKPALNRSGPAVGANLTQADGFDGSGYAVAIVDSGVDAGHPALAGRVVAEACFTRDSCGGSNPAFAEGPGTGQPCTYRSGCEHGTHVAGIAASADGQYRGIAPGVNIVSIQVFSRTEGAECGGEPQPCARARISDLARALSYLAQPTVRDTYRIVAANVSIASDATFASPCDSVSPTLRDAIGALWAAGIAATVAAGNSSNPSQLSLPACIDQAISVGATFVDRPESGWSVSNWSSTLDFAAPGVGIVSTIRGGGFGASSGTSSSAPHVAGAWAVAAQRLGTTRPATIKAVLDSSARAAVSPSGVSRPGLYLRDLSFAGIPRSPEGYFSEKWSGVPYNATPVVGSFRKANQQDVYWYSGASSVLWSWNGEEVKDRPFGAGAGFIPVPVDVNGDGLTDIYWYGNGRQNYLWMATGNDSLFRLAPASETPAAGGGFTPAPGDLNGDGRTDIVWYGQGRGDWVWLASDQPAGYIGKPLNQVFSGAPTVAAGYVPILGDFDGDHKADIFWYGPGGLPDVFWYTDLAPRILRASSATVDPGRLRVANAPVSVEGRYRLSVGDLDGDGRDDLVWDGQAQAQDTIWLGRPTAGDFGHVTVNYTGPAQPLVGNFDAVRGDDVLWYGAGSLPDAVWYAQRG